MQCFGPFCAAKMVIVFAVPRPFLGLGAESSGRVEDYRVDDQGEAENFDES